MPTKTRTQYREEGLETYLDELSREPVLTRDEERALFQRLEAGDESAREVIVERNLRFVVKIALQYRGLGVPVSDLIQEGNIGLLHVVEKFEWRKGFRFSTYAAYYIRQEIQAALHRQSGMIRIPVRKARLLGKVHEVIARYQELEGRDPSTEEIARELDIPEEKVQPLMAMRHSFASMDGDWTSDDSVAMEETLASEAPAPSAEIDARQTRAAVVSAMEFLSDREREVMELRYGFRGGRSLSLRKASKVVGLSQEGVRRVEQRALGKLRRPAIRAQLDGLLTA